MKPLAFSYSATSLFDNCPHKFQQLRLLKRFSDGNKFSFAGQEEHKALEHRLKYNKALPSTLTGMEPTCAGLLAMQGILQAEHQMCVTKDLNPCSWFSSAAWYRSIADVLVVKGRAALVIDWKTGKRRPKYEQISTLAASVLTHYPRVDVVRAAFLWVKTREKDTYKFHRAELTDLWAPVQEEAERINWCNDNNTWTKKPNGLCAEYCPVITCEHNGQG